ncbi:transmembrane protein 18-like [Anneissia japonica]|uniref:transmembrane protein 18-like n=1 Tax=Anneissia japonica TaxID=1529436 RepID=UPI00142585DB|nr:transmembrane protein 18-like [Anneissia japonica]
MDTHPQDAVRIGEIDGFLSFLKNIDWSEPWIICLLSLHMLFFIILILTRHYNNFQIVLFLFMLGLIYCSEYINEFAAKNYKSFSRLQYFDSNGLFITVVFSVPLLINSLILVSIWLYQTGSLLISVKRAKLLSKQASVKKSK